MVATALVLNVVLVRRGWSTWRTLGWDRERGLRWLVGGMVVGGVMAAGAVAVAVVGAGARVEVTGEPLAVYVQTAVGVLGVLVVAALAEELIFRGYPLARLARALGPVGASVALALVFAAVHAANPGATGFGLLNIALASLVLSAAFFTRGGMLAAWGVHVGWNMGLSIVDAPVSGVMFQLPGLEFAGGGPQWVSGGAFGPEGGIAATLVMAAALVWLVRLARREREAAP